MKKLLLYTVLVFPLFKLNAQMHNSYWRFEVGPYFYYNTELCCPTEPVIALKPKTWPKYPLGFNVSIFNKYEVWSEKNFLSIGLSYQYNYIDNHYEIDPAKAHLRTDFNFSDFAQVHKNWVNLQIAYDRALFYRMNIGLEATVYSRVFDNVYRYYQGELLLKRTLTENYFFKDLGLTTEFSYESWSFRLKYYITQQYFINLCYTTNFGS